MAIEDLSALDAMLLTKSSFLYKKLKATERRNSKEELPVSLLKTQRLELFLLYQSCPGYPKLLIFSTSVNLEILMLYTTLFSDGTFQSYPSDYLLLYIIFKAFMEKFVPLVYALSCTSLYTTSYFETIEIFYLIQIISYDTYCHATEHR
ncbi:hypothetical protein NGRA_2303 [Nosema granulosis]|uniref:Uncharacterized protein n=1 Tax=Nosema granulosis TaxID=83296 RepID=A0A9P6GWY0_9MICR|nr:hypothetical protein NGRA_2303 [Nosema granulosis]